MIVTERLFRYRWVALAVAALTQWSNALSSNSIAPLAPLFQPELGLSTSQVGIFSSAVFAGSWGVLLVAGGLTDRLGVRWMLAVGQIAAGLLLLSMAVVGSFLEAVVVMFIVGLGRGIAAPGITKAVTDWFPRSSRATAVGAKQAGMPLAGMAAAAVLPALALTVGWRYAIATVGFVVIGCGLVTAVTYRDRKIIRPRSFQRAGIISSLGKVASNRSLWILSLVSVLFISVQTSLVTYLALYFKTIVLLPTIPDEGARIVAAGGYLALCQAGGAFGRVFWGVVSDRLFQGRRMVVLAIVGAISASLSLVMAGVGSQQSLGLLSLLVFFYGASVVGWNGLWQALIVEMSGNELAATGVGLSMTLTQLGTVGGPPVFGLVVDVAGSFRPAWLLLAFVAASGAMIAALNAKGEKHLA